MRGLFVALAAVLVGAAAPPAFASGSTDATQVGPSAQRRADDPEAKEVLVDQLLSSAERRAEKAWDAAARASIRTVLLTRSLQELSQAAAQGDDHAVDILMGVRALGSNLNEWVFVPVPACRILDTRPASGAQGAGTGPYAAGTVHSFDVAAGTSGCTIPFPSAKAAVLNFIAVGASGNGNLRAWPWDSSNPPAPSTAVLNFTLGFNTSNSQVQPICNTATSTGGSCADDLFVEPFNNATHVAIDTVGYFRPATTTGSLETNFAFVGLGDLACHNLAACTITNDTSTSRGVVISATAQVQSGHTTTVASNLHISLSDVNGTTCSTSEGASGHSQWEIHPSLPTQTCCTDLTMSVIKRFTLPAGSTATYFLNAISTNTTAGSDGSTMHCTLDR